MSRTSPPPHGSPAGYDVGCRSKGGCANDQTSALLTCVEAAQRRRGDFALSRLPADVPLLRHGAPQPHEKVDRLLPAAQVHGTPWGYRRGCRSPYACPNWRTAVPTCADARADYVRSWSRRRRSAPDAVHGTSAMYLLGCRDERLCPGDELGRTCSRARSEYRRRRARAIGVMPKQELVDAEPARQRIQVWLDDGFSLREIARRTQCGRSTIAAIVRPENSRQTHISPQTMQRISQASLSPTAHEPLVPGPPQLR